MWKLFFKGKIGIIKKPSQKFVSPLYISIDTLFSTFNGYVMLYWLYMKFTLPKNLVGGSLASFSEGIHPKIEVYYIFSRTNKLMTGIYMVF